MHASGAYGRLLAALLVEVNIGRYLRRWTPNQNEWSDTVLMFVRCHVMLFTVKRLVTFKKVKEKTILPYT